LLKENVDNKNKISSLTKQLSDQSDQFNSFMAENDKRLTLSMGQIASVNFKINLIFSTWKSLMLKKLKQPNFSLMK